MSSFLLSAEQADMLELAKKDAEVLRRHAAEAYEARLMQGVELEIFDNWCGMLIPAQYGGIGVSYEAYGMVLAELAKGNPSVALWLAMHCFMMGEATRPEVSEEAKRRVFRLGMRHRFCAGVSELPSTGHLPETFTPNDVIAEQQPDGSFVINGKKSVVTGFGYSEYMAVFAHLQGTSQTTVCLIVPTTSDGIAEGSEWDSVDSFQPTRSNSVTFENTLVGPEALVFKTENFVIDAVVGYGVRTFGYMAVFCGAFEQALAIGQDMVKSRNVPGFVQPLSYHNLVGFGIGRCGFLAASARTLLQRALQAMDARDPMLAIYTMEAKIAVGELANSGLPLLTTQIGNKGANDPEFRRLQADVGTAARIPPNSQEATMLLGYLQMGQAPADAPSIRRTDSR